MRVYEFVFEDADFFNMGWKFLIAFENNMDIMWDSAVDCTKKRIDEEAATTWTTISNYISQI